MTLRVRLRKVSSWILALSAAACSQGTDQLTPPEERTKTNVEPVAADPALGALAARKASASAGIGKRAPAAPGQLVVKFKSTGAHAVTQCAQTWIRQNRSFASATADASASLDALLQHHRVNAARPLLLGRAGLPTGTATAQLRTRFAALAARRGKIRNAAPTVVNVYRLDMPPATDLEAAAAAFRRDPHVEYAHPNYVAHAVYTPNDPFLASSGSWGQAEEDLWGLSQLGIEEAWDSGRGAGVVVGVLDSGIDYNHPDIADNIWINTDEVAGNGNDDDGNGYVDDVRGWDTNDSDNDPIDGGGHGTHVAGTIAAQDNNGIGVVGVAPDAQVMAVKGLSDSGSGSFFSLAEGLLYAAMNGAHVINNSWGCPNGCSPVPVIEDAVAQAYAAGTIIVFAAGNDNNDVRHYSPQNRFEPIVVSASNPLDQRASFSNFGFVDVSAPGAGNPNASGVQEPARGILSLKSQLCASTICPPHLVVGGDYLRQAGTSMAAPHVAGLAALILSQHPDYTQEQVRQAIRRSAADAGAAGFDADFGYGRISASDAMAEETPLGVLLTVPALIEEPAAFAVMGTAAGPEFASFTLEVGAGQNPSSWTLLAQATTPIESGALGTWNVNAFADGDYTLRLRANTQDAREYEDRHLVTLDRVILSEPVSFTYHRADEPIEIVGTAAMVGLDHFDVHIERLLDGARVQDAQITLAGGGTVPVSNDVLAVWDPSNLPADHYRVVLTVTLQNGSASIDSNFIVMDPALHEGWPRVLDSNQLGIPIFEHTVLADIDGDGLAEHIVGYSNFVNAFKHDGSQAAGWPRNVAPNNEPLGLVFEAPAVGDVDGDGAPDVVATTLDGRIWVWGGNGALKPGWPQQRTEGDRQNVTLADVDGDGTLEIVLAEDDHGLDVVRSDGSSLPGFPVNPGFGLGGGVTVADLDRDGDAEIVGALADFGPYVLFAYDHTGQPLPGFPLTVGNASKRPTYPVVGDLDDDGDLEIAATAVGGNPNAGLVAVYHHDGQLLSGWPKSVVATDSSSPVLGDLDGDGSLELLTGATELTPRGALFAWKGDGSPVSGWPVFTPQQSPTPFFPPLLFDSDGDGRLEVLAARFPESGTSEDGRITALGFGLEGFTHDGVRIRELARPVYGSVPFDEDMTPSVGDLDGDGLLEMVWLEDNTIALGQVFAHLWDLETPADAVVAWNGYRGDARHSGVAQPVVPIAQLTEADRDVPINVNGLARFRVTTGSAGKIQIAHPWQADVVWGFGSDPLSPAPFDWGGSVQLQPFTTYIVRVVTPSAMAIRLSWW